MSNTTSNTTDSDVPDDYRPMPPNIRAKLIAFARETWYNDGAEGETVHRLCNELEHAHTHLANVLKGMQNQEAHTIKPQNDNDSSTP